MANLSQKQIKRQDEMWELEAGARAVRREIEALIEEPTARLKALEVIIGDIEEGVPESYQDAWDARDAPHRQEIFRNAAVKA